MSPTDLLIRSGALGRWNTFWFPPGRTRNLALCRILVVGATLFLFYPSFSAIRDLVELGGPFIEPQLLIAAISSILPAEKVFSLTTLAILYWITAVAGLTTLVGFRTRTSAFVFAMGQWIFIAFRYSFGEEHHTQALTAIFLMSLALSPSGDQFSIDAWLKGRREGAGSPPELTTTTAFWPLRLTQVLFALTYGSNGAAKLMYGGLRWMNGVTLQQAMLADGLRFERPLGVWLAQFHTLAIVLSVFTILFECSFFLTLFWPRAVPWYLMAGVALHTGIYLTMRADFFQHVILYVVFIDFEKWLDRPSRASAAIGGAHPRGHPTKTRPRMASGRG